VTVGAELVTVVKVVVEEEEEEEEEEAVVEEEEGFLIGLASAVFPFAVVEEED
jgi:hypothetical protein